MNTLKAKGLLTDFAIEVRVHVIDATLLLSGTELEFQNPAPVFYDMGDVMGQKKIKHPEYARTIHREQLFLEF